VPNQRKIVAITVSLPGCHLVFDIRTRLLQAYCPTKACQALADATILATTGLIPARAFARLPAHAVRYQDNEFGEEAWRCADAAVAGEELPHRWRRRWRLSIS
jgi:hypothetical protein